MSYRKNEDGTSRRVSLLISVLVRYPEICTVKYEPRHKTVRLSLLVTGELSEVEFADLQTRLRNSLEVYNQMGQRQPEVLQIERETYSDLVSVAITRDVRTFSPEEIYVIVEFFREQFSSRLVSEMSEYVGEDEIMAQDELIQDMLVEMETGKSSRKLIAIREDGRVMLFHK